MSEWTTVGEITLVQIQRSRLMVDQQFHADELVQAERLRLTPDGVFGLISGAWVLDRHHRQHPDADHWNENRALSVGFTSHYEHMWDLFRRTSAGSAGENVLVEADEMVAAGEIAGGIRIETAGAVIELAGAEIAEPCVGFTRFMTQRREADATDLQAELENLRQGVRGYVLSLQGLDFVEIGPGDKLSIQGG